MNLGVVNYFLNNVKVGKSGVWVGRFNKVLESRNCGYIKVYSVKIYNFVYISRMSNKFNRFWLVGDGVVVVLCVFWLKI